MKIVKGLDQKITGDDAIVLAIGFFDGIHLGHQKIIQQTKDIAREIAASCWLMSFRPHPAKVLRPNEAPQLICTRDQKIELLKKQALDAWLIMPFNRDFSTLSPEAFVDLLHTQIPGLKHVIVGANWHFGYQAKGTPELFKSLAAEYGIQTTIIDMIEAHEDSISSSSIREAIRAGDISAAQELLGRPPSLIGPVIHGTKKGREMGYPTANIQIENECIPAKGIYAIATEYKGELIGGAGYIGDWSGEQREHIGPLFEAHFFKDDLELYGEIIEIQLLKRIRDDKVIESDEELAKQIASDVELAKSAFKNCYH